jgi:hypothetical protein
MATSTIHQPPLRLTRRGRAVVLFLFVILATAASAVLFTTASRADLPLSGPAPTVVVQPDDTLWSIATRTQPHRDPYTAVGEIQRLNGLTSYVVHPGETLVLPRS